MEIMDHLNKTHFNNQCEIGSAAHVLKYNCPGTCLDFIFDKLNTPYAFGWEIFSAAKNEMGLQN